MNGINENKPKGIVYVDMPLECDLEDQVAKAMRDALGWSPDRLLDSDKRNYNSSLLVSIT